MRRAAAWYIISSGKSTGNLSRRSLGGGASGHLHLGAAEVGRLSLGVLGVVVGYGGLDGVLGEHRAVDYGMLAQSCSFTFTAVSFSDDRRGTHA